MNNFKFTFNDNNSELNNTQQMLSYYPKYEYLDNLLSCNQQKQLNIFVDVKGCITGIYQEWCVKHIINSSNTSKHLNLDLFSSILLFIAFHKRYAVKRDIKINSYNNFFKYFVDVFDFLT